MRGACSIILLAALLFPTAGMAADFRLSSPTVKDKGTIANEHVFNGFGCNGNNTSPELRWERAPKVSKRICLSSWRAQKLCDSIATR